MHPSGTHSEFKRENPMEFDNLIEQVTINPDVLQIKEDYVYLYRSLEAEGLSQNTGMELTWRLSC
ncbi:MAG: hypothetical protein CM1200mP35_08000 [Chloroflexota bacterium]|nr:MAG: hypothetical protein CM1200mP35_08000 [Chloroflexota bacterium]